MCFGSAHFRSASRTFPNFWSILKTSYILIPIENALAHF